MSDDELKAAAERIAVAFNNGDPYGKDAGYDEYWMPFKMMDDLRLLAKDGITRLAADDERAARIEELMLDVERLKGERDEARALLREVMACPASRHTRAYVEIQIHHTLLQDIDKLTTDEERSGTDAQEGL